MSTLRPVLDLVQPENFILFEVQFVILEIVIL